MLRFILGLLHFCISSDFTLFFYLSRVTLDDRFVHKLHIFMFFVFCRSGGSKKFEDWEGLKTFRTRGGYRKYHVSNIA